ncbi:hypothetical protein COE23_27475 [Bacillus cereus]|nr:hypothetical protein COE23_27475 [Bacillus cereus]
MIRFLFGSAFFNICMYSEVDRKKRGFEIKLNCFSKSSTVLKKDEPEFSISLKKGFRFFLWIKNLLSDNKIIPLKGQIVK